jgi:hypothetical protein
VGEIDVAVPIAPLVPVAAEKLKLGVVGSTDSATVAEVGPAKLVAVMV